MAIAVKKVRRHALRKLPVAPVTDTYSFDNQCDTTDTHASLLSLFNDTNFEFDLDDESENEFNVQYASGGKRRCSFFLYSFNACCGMREVGDLSNEVLTNKDMDTVFTKLFEQLKGRTVMITTIKSQKAWETWLSKTVLFQAVKTFNNVTKSTITLWVSTN